MGKSRLEQINREAQESLNVHNSLHSRLVLVILFWAAIGLLSTTTLGWVSWVLGCVSSMLWAMKYPENKCIRKWLIFSLLGASCFIALFL